MLDESSVVPTPDSAAVEKTTRKKRKPSQPSKARRLYGYGAERRSQPKTTDLIPKRWFAYSTVVLMLIAAVGLLNTLALYSPALHDYLGDAGVAAFSLRGGGTLASWFTSVLLAFTAAYCLQVYYLRKHRCDDYRGSYRGWLWAFVVFMVGSVAGAVNLGQVALNVVAATAGKLPSVGPVSVLVLAACVILTAMVIVAIWEVRVSRGAMALISVSWFTGLITVLSVEPFVQNQLAESNLILITANAWLVFSSCAFLAVLTYARYVYLAANGMLAVRPVKSKPAKAKKSSRKTASKVAKPAAKKAARKSSASAAKSKPKAKPVAKPKPAAKAKPAVEVAPVAEQKPVAASNRMDQIRKRAAAQKLAAQESAQSDAVLNQDAVTQNATETPSKLSKAERRRQRKLEKRQKRAA